jgi:hypothetical protein
LLTIRLGTAWADGQIDPAAFIDEEISNSPRKDFLSEPEALRRQIGVSVSIYSLELNLKADDPGVEPGT